jgi:biotin carboxylase
MDMTLDSDLPHRIVRTLETVGISVDGLTSFSDSYLVATAKAAEMLQLPTSPSIALEKAVDKHKCRRSLYNQPRTFRCTSEQDFREQLSVSSCELSFPLIVKPVRGGGSQGVVKVRDEQELYSTLSQTFSRSDEQVVVEPYIDGPEIDANFILHNGQILFCEISDNLPCAGDLPNANISDSFLETGIIFPSALDQNELDIAQKQLHQVLLDLGFSNGVFHVEARIDNSSKHYATGEGGILDLCRKNEHPSSDARVFLLEVNARCPGRQALSAVARYYGIDYYTMQLLLAIGDPARATALCQPFLPGCQYECCEAVYIPADAGGIFTHSNLKDELLKKRRDLDNVIVDHHTLFQLGDVVPGPETGKLRWVATFLVGSRKSRRDALVAGEVIKREVRRYPFV